MQKFNSYLNLGLNFDCRLLIDKNSYIGLHLCGAHYSEIAEDFVIVFTHPYTYTYNG
jgi:hypothetical protein